MSFIKFPSIEQYRHLIKEVQEKNQYIGRDTNDRPFYDVTIRLPTLQFIGTVKLHGTNAAVCYKKDVGVYAQSRNRVLSVTQDNSGFCAFVTPLAAVFEQLFAQIEFASDETVAIFGEWCGEGIMKGVGISKLPRMFVIFAVLIQKSKNAEQRWLQASEIKPLKSLENRIFNIFDFETFLIEIDFNNPQAKQQELEDITRRVESECPVALALGVKKGVGEGVVWTETNCREPLRMKVKGEEHRVTTSQNSAATAPESSESLDEFVKNVVSKKRLEQGIEEVFTSQNKKPTLQQTNAFIHWMQKDVMKEESDMLVASNLSEKTVEKAVADASRKWFKDYCTK